MAAGGGHPRSLEYLDALLSGGHARYPDVSTRLTEAVQHRLGLRDLDRWFATVTDLDTALAETLTLVADDVLLDGLQTTAGAERLLLGASVYREPVDDNALRYQIGDPDQAGAGMPNRRAAYEQIQQLLTAADVPLEGRDDLAALPAALQRALAPHLRELQRTPIPPRSAPATLAGMVSAWAPTGLGTHSAHIRQPLPRFLDAVS